MSPRDPMAPPMSPPRDLMAPSVSPPRDPMAIPVSPDWDPIAPPVSPPREPAALSVSPSLDLMAPFVSSRRDPSFSSLSDGASRVASLRSDDACLVTSAGSGGVSSGSLTGWTSCLSVFRVARSRSSHRSQSQIEVKVGDNFWRQILD